MLKYFIARQIVKGTKNKQFPVDYLEQKHVDHAQPYPMVASYTDIGLTPSASSQV